MPAEVAWVSVARRFASDVLARWNLPPDDRNSAELIVAELAANAARHGRCDMTLGLTLEAGLLHIAVTDSGADAGPRQAPDDEDSDEHGRGLGIIKSLAHWIDTDKDTRGRRVRVGFRITAPAL
ncbi:ATP-binding protein [Streptomyces sp. NPDC005202]|uniref:ATP-binding protein n=1 Tax=Streptomyces sp. NPDC005202 TaxID=3157021 RepID=UPI0033A37163